MNWVKVTDKPIPKKTIIPFSSSPDYKKESCERVLVYGKSVTVGNPCGREKIKDFIVIIEGDDEDKLFIEGDEFVLKEDITHWMPLPKPPE